MWERAELKSNAKAALRRFYWMAFAVCLVQSVITGFGSGGSGIRSFINSMERAGAELPSRAELPPMFLAIAGVGFMMALGVFSLTVQIFALNPLAVGLNRFFMESRSFKSDFATLFWGFTGGRYWKNVKVMALMTVKIWLWALLLVIPGIVKGIEYQMIPYLLAENPNLETNRYFELTKLMTTGEKANIFVLELSFFGWIILGVLLCGVGTLFVTPYIYATDAELYALMRAKAFAQGFADRRELPDFLPPMPPIYG